MRRRVVTYRVRLLLQMLFIVGISLLLIQLLFLKDHTIIQILPRVLLPNSYTYVDQSSVIYHNDNKILFLRQKENEKLQRKLLNETTLSKKVKEKNTDNEKNNIKAKNNNNKDKQGNKGNNNNIEMDIINKNGNNKEKDNQDNIKVKENNKNKNKTEQYIIYKFNQTSNTYKINDFVRKSILFQNENDMSSFYTGNMSIHNPNPGSYHTVYGAPIYLTSAHGRFGNEPENKTFYNGSHKNLYSEMFFSNTSGSTKGQVNFISLTGWMHESLLQEELLCCLLLKNQSVVSFTNQRRMIWYQVRKQPLFATKSYCPIPPELQPEKPIGASLSLPPYGCNLRMFLKIQYPEIRKPGSLAFCAKIAYGTLSPNSLIEWLELHRFVGVDRVMLYYYNLNFEAMSVLKHYVQEGFVGLQPFDIPQPDDPVRQVGEKAAQPFIDEQVAVYDCLEKLKGFNFVGIIDFDEIMYTGITYKHNLKTLFRYLTRRYADASGFNFKTEIFITDWLSDAHPSLNLTVLDTDKTGKLWYPQFAYRTAPMVDRVKNVFNTERVVLDSVWTHNYTSLPGYKRYTISSKLGCVKHFRSCREKWMVDGKCTGLRKYKDNTIGEILNNLKNTIREKRYRILGP